MKLERTELHALSRRRVVAAPAPRIARKLHNFNNFTHFTTLHRVSNNINIVAVIEH